MGKIGIGRHGKTKRKKKMNDPYINSRMGYNFGGNEQVEVKLNEDIIDQYDKEMMEQYDREMADQYDRDFDEDSFTDALDDLGDQ